MATPAIDILRAKAFELPMSERAELAHDLLASLDGPADSDVSEAWEAEILRRLDQLDDGTAKLIDRAELSRRMRRRMVST
jgi:putative addiction module component (TIGR02574 family)